MATGKNINRALCIAFATVTLFTAILVHLKVDLKTFFPIILPISLMTAIAVYANFRAILVLSAIAESVTLILVTFVLGLVLSYVAATSGAPMMDAKLYLLDRALGLDWWHYMYFFNSHPAIALAMHAIYLTMLPQILLAGIVLSATTTDGASERFVAALILALALTNVVSVVTPAVGIYAYLHVDVSRLTGLNPTTTFQAVDPLSHLRAGTFSALKLDQAIGIISFPSFHCAAAGLLIWIATPLKRWKWPFVILNVAMIASTPIEGAHYFIDGIAGIIVAIISLLIAKWLHRKPASLEIGNDQARVMKNALVHHSRHGAYTVTANT